MIYKSCNLLEHGICFYAGSLCACCYAPLEQDNCVPFIFRHYFGGSINIEAYKVRVKKWRENAMDNKYLRSCNNCYKLETKEWSQEDYIDQVYITHFEQCNLNCIYCINDVAKEDRLTSTYKVVPVLDDLIEKGILKQGCEFHTGGGEFSIYPECDEIVEKYIISGFAKRIAIATNGIKYSNSIAKAMQLDKACIIISIDCGSDKLYKMIKRTDAFYKLKENLSLYTKTETGRNNTFLKYIILPGINDNKSEYKKFLELAESFGICGVKIDVEGFYSRKRRYKPEKKILDFMQWTVEHAKEQNFNVETFSFYNQCYNNFK